MTGHPMVAIGDLVDSPDTWNPARANGDTTFTYIDLAAVDQSSKLISAPRQILARDAPSRARQVVASRDVLVSTVRPNLNAVAVVPASLDEAIASTGFCVLRPKPTRLDSSYLFHWVKTPEFVSHMVRRATGASYPAVSDRTVRASEIPLPPLTEQRRIADVLDQADWLRTKRRRAIGCLETVTQSIFREVFRDSNNSSWKPLPLRECYWFQEGPGIRNWQFTDNGVKLLNVGNIEKDGVLNLEKTSTYLAEEEAQRKYRHFLVDPGDLVIASSGISFDQDGLLRTRGAFVSQRDVPLCMNTSTIRFKAIEGVSDLRFLWVWLGSTEFRSQITRRVTGSAQQNFGPSHLKSLTITLPPLPVQREFAIRVEAVSKLRSAQESQQDELKSFLSSLEHRAFRGEL